MLQQWRISFALVLSSLLFSSLFLHDNSFSPKWSNPLLLYFIITNTPLIIIIILILIIILITILKILIITIILIIIVLSLKTKFHHKMPKQIQNQQTMTKYLNGALPCSPRRTCSRENSKWNRRAR